MENDNIAKKFNLGECAGICSVGGPQQRWIDTMKGYIKKQTFEYQESKENGA